MPFSRLSTMSQQIYCVLFIHNHQAGLKKLPSDHPGQVDFPVSQVTLHSCFPNRGAQASHLKTKKNKPRLNLGKQHCRAACPKGKLEINFFSALAMPLTHPCHSPTHPENAVLRIKESNKTVGILIESQLVNNNK